MFRNFFSRKSRNTLPAMDFSFAYADMHSHLIPGIDDGAQVSEESLELIKELYARGFRKLITTPHVMSDFYRNSSETILEGRDVLRSLIKNEPDLEGLTIDAAAEYYVDDGLQEKVEKNDILTFGKNYLLFEISYINYPDNLDAVIFSMQTNNYKPVLAHPERYPFWYSDFERYKKLKDVGVLFQINVNSLTGYYSPGAKKMAEKLIDNNMVDFIGTDTHNMRHIHTLQDCMTEKYLHKISGMKLLNNTL